MLLLDIDQVLQSISDHIFLLLGVLLLLDFDLFDGWWLLLSHEFLSSLLDDTVGLVLFSFQLLSLVFLLLLERIRLPCCSSVSLLDVLLHLSEQVLILLLELLEVLQVVVQKTLDFNQHRKGVLGDLFLILLVRDR